MEKTKSTKCSTKQISTNNAINHPALVKHLCNAILDRSLPLSKGFIDKLKLNREVVRKMARG